jgi:hypothetical protein
VKLLINLYPEYGSAPRAIGTDRYQRAGKLFFSEIVLTDTDDNAVGLSFRTTARSLFVFEFCREFKFNLTALNLSNEAHYERSSCPPRNG